MAGKDDIALELDEARRGLEDGIREVVGRHSNGGGIELSLNLIEEPDAGSRDLEEKNPELYGAIMQQVEKFFANPAVRESNVSIYSVQAIDSDGDGEAAVNVQYEYAVNPGMRGAERSVAGGTGSEPVGPSNTNMP